MGKRFIFRNYWWIAVAGAAIATTIILLKSKPPDCPALIGATIGGALGFCYFVQKQNLDELRLFKDLFTEFNRRYDEMNAKLEEIRSGKQANDASLRKALVDYFNLCAEEYLYYREGFIHEAAWRSWCLGMSYYLENAGILEIWHDEVRRDSYYGLTLDVIQKGANLPRNTQ